MLRGLLSPRAGATGDRAEWTLGMGCGRGSFDSKGFERWAQPAVAVGGNLSLARRLCQKCRSGKKFKLRYAIYYGESGCK